MLLLICNITKNNQNFFIKHKCIFYIFAYLVELTIRIRIYRVYKI